MTATQQIVTIGLMALGVMTTRFISFVLFSSEKRTPRFVHYLSQCLPSAVFGILVVYCLKDVEFLKGDYGIPQIFGIICCVLLHLWRKNMLLSIAGGTVFNMLLIHII